jgi:hypothetical protein
VRKNYGVRREPVWPPGKIRVPKFRGLVWKLGPSQPEAVSTIIGAAALPLSRQRCNHFIAELTLTSKSSAASRRDAPISTASITRSRSSPEHAFAIAHPRKGESMCKDSLIHDPLGIPPIQIGWEPL